MEKVEPAATVVVEPQKNLARRLDFTANCNASMNAILPEHPQARLQSKLVALAQAQAQAQSQPQPVAQWQMKQQPQAQPQVQPRPPVPRVLPVTAAQPVKSLPRPSFQVIKADSPKSRPSSKVELKGATPKKRKRCNCKNSLCLKLYCECFASGISCDGCNCVNCHNNVENEAARQEAVEATLERSRKAFKFKNTSPHRSHDGGEEAGEILLLTKQNKGCNCKKSGCLKRYCECFQAGILCTENCKCLDCKNFEGSEERRALFCEDKSNLKTYIQQAANAAINGAIDDCGFGTSELIKKRRIQQLTCESTPNYRPDKRTAEFQEENHIARTSTFSPLSSANQPGAATLTLSRNSNLRSLLADVVRPQDVNELCSVLVEVSVEAAKAHAGKGHLMNKQMETAKTESLVGPTTQQSRDGNSEEVAPQRSGNHVDRVEISTCDEPKEVDLQSQMALSPRTLSLMCNEEDIILTEDRAEDSSPAKKDFSEVYAEQEKLVLTRLWECLNRVIACGSIKESMRLSH